VHPKESTLAPALPVVDRASAERKSEWAHNLTTRACL
jgi:hypothetical protein